MRYTLIVGGLIVAVGSLVIFLQTPTSSLQTEQITRSESEVLPSPDLDNLERGTTATATDAPTDVLAEESNEETINEPVTEDTMIDTNEETTMQGSEHEATPNYTTD